MVKIGILALQGDFHEHALMLSSLNAQAREVRREQDLQDLNGLIIPGGESTTIGRLARDYGLLEPLRRFAGSGRPVWGTCAGMIFLAKNIGPEPAHLALMDIEVRRNAFGRQTESFEADLESPFGAFRAVFIRAPLIERAGPDVEVLARLPKGAIVAARQKNLLATSFHPELTADTRWHRFFLTFLANAN
ncbi:MAG: pyridoxal 5'-phosphate synthase glutaminase subunit PdxT [Elusimicrobia bacterium]|nr:pyridoxal 5'-phosphate synthase glutaminase subunit PdxT [Elusimicrobiota bacterium]